MKAAYLLLRFLKVASLLAFIVLLFIAYSYMPPQVAVHFNDVGRADRYIDKAILFYVSGIFIVLFNVILSISAKFIFTVPPQLFPMPNRSYWLADKENKREFHEILRDWLNSFVIIGNGLLFLLLFALMKLNRIDDADAGQYSWILFVGLAVLLVWIFFLPVRLLIKKNSLAE